MIPFEIGFMKLALLLCWKSVAVERVISIAEGVRLTNAELCRPKAIRAILYTTQISLIGGHAEVWKKILRWYSQRMFSATTPFHVSFKAR